MVLNNMQKIVLRKIKMKKEKLHKNENFKTVQCVGMNRKIRRLKSRTIELQNTEMIIDSQTSKCFAARPGWILPMKEMLLITFPPSISVKLVIAAPLLAIRLLMWNDFVSFTVRDIINSEILRNRIFITLIIQWLNHVFVFHF